MTVSKHGWNTFGEGPYCALDTITRLTEHKGVMRKHDVNNHIAEQHQPTNHTIH